MKKGHLKIVLPDFEGRARTGMGTKISVVADDGMEIEVKGVRRLVLDVNTMEPIEARIEVFEIDMPGEVRAALTDLHLITRQELFGELPE